MRYLNYLLAVLMAALLAACGGGGGSSGSNGGGGTTPATTVAAIEVLASAATLSSASANSITVTALVKNASNNGVASVPVAFAASSGVLQSVAATTDASGNATATLSPGSDRSNRDITITVSAGGKSQTLTVPVVGTNIAVAGAGSILLAGQASYAVTVRDSGGNAIAGVPVTMASSLGNGVSPASANTNESGVVNFQYTAAKSGNDVLTFGAAGAQTTFNVAVSSVDFSVVSPSAGAEVPVNTPQAVTVRYLSGGSGVAGQVVNFSSTRGGVSPATATTDAQGLARTTVTSSTAGPATVTAQIGGGAQTSVGLNFTASDPSTIVLQINPGAIPPNTAGSSTNRAQLTAVVRDASGNPVKGRTVNFTAVADASGGRINTGTGVTDANGTVTDLFISGALTTAANGVRIQATVANTAVSDVAVLTVSNQSLFITIATSNTISNVNESTYSKPFAVQVNDANGAAVANQVVTLSVFPTFYKKGVLDWTGTVWAYSSTVPPLTCANEDQGVVQNGSRFGARDGVLQPGEDVNGDGRLTPGLPGVIAPASVTTDASGLASFNLMYGENQAKWVQFEITARAVVAGTESRSVHLFDAEGSEGDFTSETVPPAAANSPYGITNQSCTNPN